MNPNPRIIELLEIYYTLFFLSGIAFLLASRKYRQIRSVWQKILVIYVVSLIVHAILTMGAINFAVFFGVGMIVTVVTEWLAMKYNFWGRYQYSRKFTPALPGGMPLPVVVAWGTILLFSYWVALALFSFMTKFGGLEIPIESTILLRLTISLIASIIAVGFDLIMDPVMVKYGHWKWKATGKWHGIPFVNFVGWFITCAVAFMVVFSLIDPLAPLRMPYFTSGVQWLFVGIYLALIADVTLDAVKMKLVGPAVIGLLFIAFVGAVVGLLTIN